MRSESEEKNRDFAWAAGQVRLLQITLHTGHRASARPVRIQRIREKGATIKRSSLILLEILPCLASKTRVKSDVHEKNANKHQVSGCIQSLFVNASTCSGLTRATRATKHRGHSCDAWKIYFGTTFTARCVQRARASGVSNELNICSRAESLTQKHARISHIL